jgi:hypothetical protein
VIGRLGDSVYVFTQSCAGDLADGAVLLVRACSQGLGEIGVDANLHAHLRTRPYTPRTNGKVERYQQTLAREWAYAMQYASSTARQEALPHWLNHYNEHRHHSAISNQPPLTRVRNLLGQNS